MPNTSQSSTSPNVPPPTVQQLEPLLPTQYPAPLELRWQYSTPGAAVALGGAVLAVLCCAERRQLPPEQRWQHAQVLRWAPSAPLGVALAVPPPSSQSSKQNIISPRLPTPAPEGR